MHLIVGKHHDVLLSRSLATLRLLSLFAPQDDLLRRAVDEGGAKNWKSIAARYLPQRTDQQCIHRWQKVLKPGIKGPWTAEDDARLVKLVREHGAKKWSLIASFMPGRIGKQCRERWHNHLDPAISKHAWSEDEDRLILEYHVTKGNRWSEMSRLLPGR